MKTVLTLVFFWASAMLGYGQEQVFDSVLKKGNASLVFDRPSADVGFCTRHGGTGRLSWVFFTYSVGFVRLFRSFLYFCIPKIKAN